MKAARTRALNRKHAGTAKHGHTSKHTGTAQRHAAKAHKQVARRAAATVKAAHLRAWSPDEAVALCSARAVAESFRIALGRPVSDSVVLDLYWSVAESAESGASILAALDAFPGDALAEDLTPYLVPETAGLGEPVDLVGLIGERVLGALSADVHPIILGLDLPWGEPHAVVAHDGAWWSWGEPYDPADFPGAVIEEAWAVTWA